MIIDAHAHLGVSWYGWYENRVDADGLVKVYDKFGVDKACISAWQIFYDVRKGNDEIYEAVKKHPNRFIGFGIISPRYRQEAVYEVDRCVKELGMKGLKMHPSAGGWYADSDIVNPVMEKARQYNLPILIHSWNDEHSNPRAIGALAARYPEVTILMGHMGFEDWLEAIMVAKKNKNILLDTTGTTSDLIIIKTAYEEVGAERIVFGSDAPSLGVAPEMAKVVHADIPEEEKKKILGENMMRVLKIK